MRRRHLKFFGSKMEPMLLSLVIVLRIAAVSLPPNLSDWLTVPCETLDLWHLAA